ncbi:MAG TPA: molybdate ABC transporter substrate-binding protein [Polyangia bacterium]|nr:molybdate ABC transporter substrate-binding protein [Polyangia bacterium]
MSARSFIRISALALIAAAGCHSSAPGTASSEPITLAAAASLRSVLPSLAKAFGAPDMAITYGASGDLKRQVEHGAPVDAVLFASSAPVDALIKGGLADADSRKVLATNQLVLIGPKGGKPLTFATIDQLPAGERIAIGDPGAVPAGQYARDLFQKLGKWDVVQAHLVLAGDVGQVLAYARRGEVAAAVVYRTDLHNVDDVAILDEAKGDQAPRPEVVAAITHGGHAAARARAFLDFIASPPGQKILHEFGFGPP